MKMTKTGLRTIYLNRRKSLSKMELLNLSERIFINFISRFKVASGQNIHLFMPIEKFNEVNTGFFFRYFTDHGVKIYLPKMVGKKIIAVEYTRNSRMVKNSWGISEPESSVHCQLLHYDYVITPLVYCDPDGNRIGYGKGYYDEFFSSINESSIRVGVSLFKPAEYIDDVSDSDVRLHYLVTPDEILSFSGV